MEGILMTDKHIAIQYLNKLEVIAGNHIIHQGKCPVLTTLNPSVAECKCGARDAYELFLECSDFLHGYFGIPKLQR